MKNRNQLNISDLTDLIFPQMDDGVVNDADLTDNIVSYIVQPSSSTKLGDSLTLFIDNTAIAYHFIDDDSDLVQAWIGSIPAYDLPDGIYVGYYRVVDAGENASFSDPSLLFIQRDAVPPYLYLPAPSYPNAVENIIDGDNIVEHSGINVHIPTYTSIASGDQVTVTWRGYTYITGAHNYQPAAEYSEVHTVTEEETLNGFEITVPQQDALSVGIGVGVAWYQVNGHISSAAVVEIDAEETVLLPPPVYDDVNEFNIIPEASIEDHGILVTVDYSPDMQVGQQVTLYWQGYEPDGSENSNVAGSLVGLLTTDDPYTFKIDESQAVLLNNGRIDCFYTVEYIDGITAISATASANIDLDVSYLEPPVFTDAENGQLDIDDVREAGSTQLFISYEDIEEGDVITVFTYGVDANNQSVTAASYTSGNHIVTPQEAASKHVYIDIPASVMTSVGENGRVSAYYEVDYISDVKSTSPITTVTMVDDGGGNNDSLTLYLTTGAAPIDLNITPMKPYNRGVILGPAGASGVLSAPTTTSAIFNDLGNEINYQLDQNGLFHFRVSSTLEGNVVVTAFGSNGDSISAVTDFGYYRQTTTNNFRYNYTTRAPANYYTQCSIYIDKAALTTNSIHATLGGSETAVFANNLSQTQIVSFGSDNTITLDIINSEPGLVNVLLAPSNGAADATYISGIQFVEYP
ncbi:MAG: hypothetical protein ACK5NC_03400 [Vibrio sp.]